MTTANDLISGALRIISSVTPGEAVDGTEAGDALVILNDLLASWSAESNMAPFNTKETFPLVASQESYVIGQSGSPDFNTVRPDEIQDFYCTDTAGGLDYDMEPMTQEQYDAISLKNVGSIPRNLFYNAQYPNGEIFLYPTAGTSTFTLTLVSLKPLAQFSLLTSAVILPPQYTHATKMLLADLLAFEYGYDIQPGSRLATEIERCRSMIKSKNTRRVTAGFDAIFRRNRRFNILQG